MRYWFQFNGINSADIGIIIPNQLPLNRPKERVTTVTVPGRAGNLILAEAGDEGFENYVVSFDINIRGDRVHEAMRALRGEGWLTLSNDPGRKQKARVINAWTLKKISKGLDWWQTTVAFTCSPLKRNIAEIEMAFSNGQYINNDGDIAERPVITLRGGGLLSVNGFSVSDCTDGCIIDCDALEVTDLNGEVLLTSASSGEFPAFDCGSTQLTLGDNVTGCFIKRRQRYL